MQVQLPVNVPYTGHACVVEERQVGRESVFVRKGTTYVFPESACMLATDGMGALVLVEQFREPRAEWTLELPGGLVQPDEAPVEAAIREFEEETGLRIGESQFLFTLDLDLSTAIHRTHVFSSTIIGLSPDVVAEFQIRRLKLEETLGCIRSGIITHAPTVAATLAMALRSKK